MKSYRQIAAALLLSAALPVAASAHPPIAASEAAASFEQDRADILAMAGNYRVSFNMQESTRWDPDYEVLEPKRSGGNEVVRVIEDTGRKIVLQHLLVITDENDKTHIIKHWRQDWEYEPARLLVYSDRNGWTWEDVPEKMRTGRWSQTVWQVDDSPRYGGWGQFETQAGIRRWRSNWTWRPLARRDAVRNPVYDRYYSINRQQPTPDGWVHWQDNTKMGIKNGKLVPIVQEYVLNTYIKYDNYDVKAADDYWAATKDYWAAVRAEWDRVAQAKGGIAIQEQADTGTVISGRLLEIADEVQDKKLTTAKAIAEATKLIEANTKQL
ncbi:MAG: hypothetical protein DI569_05825 [Sphingopyxis macrogoltabida]|uniref:Uncharacterized protein n=1 Tax=Sphingopyxis macrogoltabida TaxID=33050 RepID=A0A2W5L6R4_SPHMC|nr:MAG: hypothetical protein DI569_05825 [Sphingopyxis macrogoltabida]